MALGALLGRHLAVLGGSWAALGRSWAFRRPKEKGPKNMISKKHESARYAEVSGRPRANPLDVFSAFCEKSVIRYQKYTKMISPKSGPKTPHTVGESKKQHKKNRSNDVSITNKKTSTPWGLARKRERFLNETGTPWSTHGDQKSARKHSTPSGRAKSEKTKREPKEYEKRSQFVGDVRGW